MCTRLAPLIVVLAVAVAGCSDAASGGRQEDTCTAYRDEVFGIQDLGDLNSALAAEELQNVASGGPVAFEPPGATQHAERFQWISDQWSFLGAELEALGTPPPELQRWTEALARRYELLSDSYALDAAAFAAGDRSMLAESERLFQEARSLEAEIQDLESGDLCAAAATS